MSITLTVAEIADLAEFAGLVVERPTDAYDLETELTVCACPKEGVLNDGEPSDPNIYSHYRLIAYFSEYPEEGCHGLGSELAALQEQK